jgi:peptidoglycan/xylan/chitin deacetylase (PgdA/CDA1 family)
MEAGGTQREAGLMSVLALLYHDIVKREQRHLSGFQGADADIYKLDPDEFTTHMEGIQRLKALKMLAEGDAQSPVFERVRITVDDGGAGAWAAAEILERFGWRGYFFIVTDRINDAKFLHESQIADLHRRGHKIGSHSCSHPGQMWSCTAEQLEHEWGDSTRKLSQIIQTDVTLASVPFGFYSPRVGEAASKAGIRTLFTSEPVTSYRNIGQCTVLGRFSVQEGVPGDWVCSLVAGMRGPRYERYLSWNGKKLLKRAGGQLWLRARRKILAMRAGTGSQV